MSRGRRYPGPEIWKCGPQTLEKKTATPASAKGVAFLEGFPRNDPKIDAEHPPTLTSKEFYHLRKHNKSRRIRSQERRERERREKARNFCGLNRGRHQREGEFGWWASGITEGAVVGAGAQDHGSRWSGA